MIMRQMVFTLLLSLVVAHAQMLNPAAEALIKEGQAAMQDALATYERHYPDQPLWREAIEAGREAVRLAPGQAEPLRFLAEVYSRSNWYGPAYQTWNQFLDLGFGLDADAVPLFVAVTSELAYTSYSNGQLNTALAYYQRLIDVVPYEMEGYIWVGRILLETARPAQAITYWETVVQRDVSDQRAQYFLKLAQDQAAWGIEAVNAFREGVALYDRSDMTAAKERFARAISQNEMYAEAWAWLGRVYFEEGDYQDAVIYYREANRLEPENETYRYFFQESQRRS